MFDSSTPWICAHVTGEEQPVVTAAAPRKGKHVAFGVDVVYIFHEFGNGCGRLLPVLARSAAARRGFEDIYIIGNAAGKHRPGNDPGIGIALPRDTLHIAVIGKIVVEIFPDCCGAFGRNHFRFIYLVERLKKSGLHKTRPREVLRHDDVGNVGPEIGGRIVADVRIVDQIDVFDFGVLFLEFLRRAFQPFFAESADKVADGKHAFRDLLLTAGKRTKDTRRQDDAQHDYQCSFQKLHVIFLLIRFC